MAVKEYGGKVYVLGEVKHPGIYPVNEGLTALGACAVAGGLSDFAAPRRARVTRTRDGKRELLLVDLVRVRQGKAEDPASRLSIGDAGSNPVLLGPRDSAALNPRMTADYVALSGAIAAHSPERGRMGR